MPSKPPKACPMPLPLRFADVDAAQAQVDAHRFVEELLTHDGFVSLKKALERQEAVERLTMYSADDMTAEKWAASQASAEAWQLVLRTAREIERSAVIAITTVRKEAAREKRKAEKAMATRQAPEETPSRSFSSKKQAAEAVAEGERMEAMVVLPGWDSILAPRLAMTAWVHYAMATEGTLDDRTRHQMQVNAIAQLMETAQKKIDDGREAQIYLASQDE